MNGPSFSYNGVPNASWVVQPNGFSVPAPYYMSNGLNGFSQSPMFINVRGVPLNRPPPTASTQAPTFIQPQVLQNPQMCVPPPPFTQASAIPHSHTPNSAPVLQPPFIMGDLGRSVGPPPQPPALTSASYDENFQHVQSLDGGSGGSRTTPSFSTYTASSAVNVEGTGDMHHHHLSSFHHHMQPPPTLHPQTVPAHVALMHAQPFPQPPQNFQERPILVQQPLAADQTPSFTPVEEANNMPKNQANILGSTALEQPSSANVLSTTSSIPSVDGTLQPNSAIAASFSTDGAKTVNEFANALQAKPFVPNNHEEENAGEVNPPTSQSSQPLSDQRSAVPTPNQQRSQRQTPIDESEEKKSWALSANEESASWRSGGNTTETNQKSNSHDSNNSSGSRPTPDATKSMGYHKNQSKRFEMQICYFCKINNKPEADYTSHSTLNGEKVTCSVLKENGCSICGANGEEAHPEIYCDEKASSESFTTFAKNFIDRIYINHKYNSNGHNTNNLSTYHNSAYNNNQHNYYRGGGGNSSNRNTGGGKRN